MTKTWETLFHLSNFMKYLLYDVLPNEKSSSPQFVLDSLMDLLQTTLECIQHVRDKNIKFQNTISQLKVNVHEIIESKAEETILQAQRGKSGLTMIKQEKKLKHTNVQMDNEINACSSNKSDNYEAILKVLPTKVKSVALKSYSGRCEKNQHLDELVQKENNTSTHERNINHEVTTIKQEKQQEHTNVQMLNETCLYSKKNNDHNETVLPCKEKSVGLKSYSGRSGNNQHLDGSIQNDSYMDSDGNNNNHGVTKIILLNKEEISARKVLEPISKEEQSCVPIPKECCIEIEENNVAYKETIKGEADYLVTTNKKNKKEEQRNSGVPKQKEIKPSRKSCVNFEKSKTVKVAEKGDQMQQEQFDLLTHEENNLNSLRNCENHSSDFIKDKETLHKIIIGSGTVTRHQSIIINTNFIFLNEQIASGLESYGAFCLPCDKGFFSASDWHSHLNDDYKHLKMSCKEISCKQCAFFICGNSVVLEVYLDFHTKSHNSESKKIEVSNHSSSDSSNVPYNKPQSYDNKLVKDFPKNLLISSSFAEVHTKLITNAFNEGYYCEICDGNFFSNNEWLHHLQDCHHQEDEEKHIIQCNICSLVIFSFNESRNNLFLYHHQAHESENSLLHCKITQPLSTRSSCQDLSQSCNISSLSRTSSSLELNSLLNTSNDHQKAKGRRRARTIAKAKQNNSKELVFSDNFLELNKNIHKGDPTEAYYCRPCDKVCYSLKDWEVHCIKKTHTSFMQNRKFQNSEAICSFCNMIIVGSRWIVIGYMKYHSAGHNKVPCYELKLISDEDHIQAKPVNSSNTERPHIDNSSQGDSFSVTKTEPTDNLNDIHYEEDTSSCKDNSWFHQDLISRIKGLFLDRKKRKLSGKILTFHGFCLVCDSEIEDAFEWMDHLELDLHCSKLKEYDEELIYREFNITIFGNKSLISEALPY